MIACYASKPTLSPPNESNVHQRRKGGRDTVGGLKRVFGNEYTQHTQREREKVGWMVDGVLLSRYCWGTEKSVWK